MTPPVEEESIVHRRNALPALIAALLVALAPGLARAVATTIDVSRGGEPLPGAKIRIVDETGTVTAEGETDDRGRLVVDLAPGHHYRAETPDGAHTSDGFFAGDPVKFDLPAAPAEVAIPGWSLQVDLFAGYERQNADVSARGDAEVEELVEVRLGPFPDSPTALVPTLVTLPVDASDSDALEEAIAGGQIQLAGPPCGCIPFSPRPLFFLGVPHFGDLDGRFLDEPLGNAGDLKLTAEQRAFNVGIGGLFPLDCGFDVEAGLFYEYQRIHFQGTLPGGADADETAHVHGLGLRLGLGRTFLRRGGLGLGAFARVEGVFPLSGDESVRLRGGNSDLRFDLDPDFDFRAVAGLRLDFDLNEWLGSRARY